MSDFHFKRFSISQDKCAQKVGTLGCVLGAWASFEQPNEALDIGCGTGVLSLMLAQRYACAIDAVEIDAETFEQAKHNIEASPWNVQVMPYLKDIKEFRGGRSKFYDLIVCNPPFYQNSLKSPSLKINKARHEESLKLHELAISINRLLSKKGLAFVILPPPESADLLDYMQEHKLYANKELEIYNFQGKKPLALIRAYSREKARLSKETLVIWESHKRYSSQYQGLLKEYLTIF